MIFVSALEKNGLACEDLKELKDMSLEELWQLFPIILKEHNPDYAIWYDEEEKSLACILDNYHVCRISHIGSTSVDGLIAKPIVDILLELPDAYDLDAIAGVLQNSGWIVMARDDTEKTLDLNKGYTPSGFADKVYHLHIRRSGDWDELYLRDYLRQYPHAARQYEALKQSLKMQFEHNRDAYTNAKSDFITMHTRKAREEFPGRYLPLS